MKTGYFVIVAYARSGSTLLCGILDAFSDANVYREIFHYHMKTIRQSFGGDADLILEPSDLPEGEQRRLLVIGAPDYLARISELIDQKLFVFKVFNGHLPPKPLQAVIEGSQGVIILRRNLVHAFISNEIAMARQVWGGAETSSDEVVFDAPKFFKESRAILEFQKIASDIANAAEIPVSECNYEDIADPDSGQEKVLTVMEQIKIPRKPDHEPRLIPKRQDTRRFASDKVSNKEDLLSALKLIDSEQCNDGTVKMDMTAVLEKLREVVS